MVVERIQTFQVALLDRTLSLGISVTSLSDVVKTFEFLQHSMLTTIAFQWMCNILYTPTIAIRQLWM